MKHRFCVQVGPVSFRLGSTWRKPITELQQLYANYPVPAVADLTARLDPDRPWRRWVRPAIGISGDFWLPEAAPLPLRQGLLAAEMAMNLQVALGWRRHLLLHCSAVERDGRVLLMAGASGSGKSTLATLLALSGWRFLGDEFAFFGLHDGCVHPFPRPSSLKGLGIEAVRAAGGDVGPVLEGTPKGRLGYWRAPVEAVVRMMDSAPPALILFPRFGQPKAAERLAASDVFMRLTQASTNYVSLGQRAFLALTRLVHSVPAFAVDYPDSGSGLAVIERLWDAS